MPPSARQYSPSKKTGQTHRNWVGSKKNLEEVIMAPPALDALGFDAYLEGLLSL
jgi:hypothetical protein